MGEDSVNNFITLRTHANDGLSPIADYVYSALRIIVELTKFLFTTAGRSELGSPMDSGCPGRELKYTKAPIELFGLPVCLVDAAPISRDHQRGDPTIDTPGKNINPSGLGLPDHHTGRLANSSHVLVRNIHRTRWKGDKKFRHDELPDISSEEIEIRVRITTAE